MHASYLMLTQTPALKALSRLDVLGLLIAALCHDIDHPGCARRVSRAAWRSGCALLLTGALPPASQPQQRVRSELAVRAGACALG